MSKTPLEHLNITDVEHWKDGPPHAVFKRLRDECPIHWSEMPDYPGEAGLWSVTKASHARAVSLDWEAYSSELGGFLSITNALPHELSSLMMIGMDPPRHDRIKSLFQRGFTPKRVAEHEPAIRAIAATTLTDLAPRRGCDLVGEVAQPIVSRVFGRFMGIPQSEDDAWAELMHLTLAAGDPDTAPGEVPAAVARVLPEVIGRCQDLVERRRANARDDLASALVHAEVDGEHLDDHEIVMGLVLFMAAGIDSTKATFAHAVNALLADRGQWQLLLDEPDLIPSAVEEALRMFPALAHFRRTATRDTELGGQHIKRGDKVVLWYVSANRDENCYSQPDRFDVRRNPDHQAFGAGGRHFCLGAALARLELRVLLEETLNRFPEMHLSGDPEYAQSHWINQLTSLPVRW